MKLWPFPLTITTRPQRQPLRAIVATKRENTAAARRKVETTLLLAVYAAVTPLQKRKDDTDAYFASVRGKR